MKIDESCINHNAVRLIGEIASMIYDCPDEEHEISREMMLGEICGILDMAKAMKEVLDG